MTGRAVVRVADAGVIAGEGRCNSCGGFKVGTIEVAVVFDPWWDIGEPLPLPAEVDEYTLDLCSSCVGRLAAGADIKATLVVEVTP